MTDWTFSPADRQQIRAMGLTEKKVREQLRFFHKPPFSVHLERPCRVGDGIQVIPPDKIPAYLSLQAQAAQAGRWQKFVPASGAASRMFHTLCQCLYRPLAIPQDLTESDCAQEQKEVLDLVFFLNHLERFAFYPDLQKALERAGHDLHVLRRHARHQEILACLLTEHGLNYQAAPKWRLKFHAYPEGNRTPLEEHLVEGVHYLRDQWGNCCFHFTISPGHQHDFEGMVNEIRPRLESAFNCRLNVTFSFQKDSTNTLAVDMENRPFRDQNGRLLFRPGGHGALLENLNDLKADLIYIKNIDNVAPDRLKEPTLLWKKILGGYLVYLQARMHDYLQKLTTAPPEAELCRKIMEFSERRLLLAFPPHWPEWSSAKKRDFLVHLLNRPLRVCGVVPNAGEPGGAPFWVRDRDGNLSLQIVESAQVDQTSPAQKAIWAAATHFNPVDLVCSVRDYKGVPFQLLAFADPEAVFISEKFQDGRKLKALELPGLWNGGMARWLTLFVEVPPETFCPVKTVFDLLRPEHLP